MLFSESASLASEAKGLAVSINQATSRFIYFFFTIALSGLKEKHTLSSYTETENNEIQGTKTTIIQMDDTRSILFVCCFGFFFFFAGCLTYIPTVHSNTEIKICRTTIQPQLVHTAALTKPFKFHDYSSDTVLTNTTLSI